ncbi:DUF4129 domain-containing protein [Natronomonas marina]|uniref:DUF4129 domain-containing protein n=1 Tax=Natronomonas marina TaxID=2961939 RepID=UPI0020C9A091|nr:DUF4129 domain-containing protein [Natronomonas marina]
MDRDRALPLLVALLAIVALSLAAATLDSAVDPGGSGFGGGSDTGVGDDDPGETPTPKPAVGEAADPTSEMLIFSTCFPFLQKPPALLALFVVFGGVFAATYRLTKSKFAGLAVCAALALPGALVYGGLAFCGESSAAPQQTSTEGGPTPNGSNLPEGGGGGLGETGTEALSSPSLLLALLVVVALAVVVVAVLATGSDRAGTAEEPTEDLPEDAPETIGRVAGTAADRIDADGDVDAENEVYRAWREMTESLAVASPETTTPREFERAAVDAGMDREDVAALTDLFESVRYGGLEPTDEQERRAVETLRRIESGYGED